MLEGGGVRLPPERQIYVMGGAEDISFSICAIIM